MSTLDLAMLTEFPYNVAAGGVALGALGASFYLARKYLAGGVCHSKARLDGKVAIITGANTGIGKETAVDFAQRNARVIMACRNVEKGREALDEVLKRSGSNKVVLKKLDLSSLASVRKFAEEILKEEPRLDILVNNAGVMMCPYSKTEDGFEMQIGVNHFGHFLLTNLLLDRLKEAPKARIVNVSSVGHYFTWGIKFYDINSEKSYSKIVAYAQSKLANILFTKALAKRLEGTNVTVNALHPGPVATDLERHTGLLGYINVPTRYLVYKSCWEGAQTSIYCAVSEEMEGVSGQYLADCKIKKSSAASMDSEMAEHLWDVSMKAVGLEE